MDLDNENLPSIIYTSDDSAENGQSDDSADVGQSDDSAEVLQSDDSADVNHSDTTYIDSDEPAYIAQNVCSGVVDDESRLFLLDAGSDGGRSCAVSPALVPAFSLCHPLTGGGTYTSSSATPTHRQIELCNAIPVLSDTTVHLDGITNQHLYLPDAVSEVTGGSSRSPSPSESSTQSLGSQEAIGLLSPHHQYQPLCGDVQQQAQHTTVHYAHPEHNITTKIRCDPLDPLNKLIIAPTIGGDNLIHQHHCPGGDLLQVNPERWLVANIHIDARYRDAFYVKWNWRKIRSSCVFLNLAVLLSLLVVGVALLMRMPHGHDCDPVREWWQGHVSYHVLVPSFKDSNGDGIGDLQGVVSKLNYIQSLGVSMVRLAPMFEKAEHHYERLLVPPEPDQHLKLQHLPQGPPGVVWNLTRLSSVLGSSGEVQLLAALLHERRMKLLLDLPLAPGIPTTDVSVPGVSASWSAVESVSLVVVSDALREVQRSLHHWIKMGVDGFCFPDLHLLITNTSSTQIVEAVESWRELLDRSPRVGFQQRILVLPAKLVHSLSAAALAPVATLPPAAAAGPVASLPPAAAAAAADPSLGWNMHDLRRNAVPPPVAHPDQLSGSSIGWGGISGGLDAAENDTVTPEFTLSQRVVRAAHLLEENLQLAASPADVIKQVEATLELSSSPSSPWIFWSMSGVGLPRLSELAPASMRLEPRPYHLYRDSTTQQHHQWGNSQPSNNKTGDRTHHLQTAAAAAALGTEQLQDNRDNNNNDDDVENINGKKGFWSSVGRNFLILFLPGSTSLYYGDEVDVTAPTDMKDLGWAGIMAWSGNGFGEFSTRDPWMRLDEHYEWHNVENRRNSTVAAVATMVQHKREQPPLFINGLFNYEGDFHPTHSSNIKVRYLDDKLLILDRFYPRRRMYMLVANLGTERLERDLSHFYYGGEVVASSHGKSGYIKFRRIALMPSEVLVCALDK